MLNLNIRDRVNYNDGKNYMEFENICSALKESIPDFDLRTLKPYLWRDEIKDIFMLTQKAEIYLYNRNKLGHKISRFELDSGTWKAVLIFKNNHRKEVLQIAQNRLSCVKGIKICLDVC